MSYTADINDGRRPWGGGSWGDRTSASNDRTWGDRASASNDRSWGDGARGDRAGDRTWNSGDQRDRAWCGPGAHRMHPAGLILLTVLGFMLWWPLGLAM